MKKLFILFFSLVLFVSLLTPNQVNGQTDKAVLLRQIEILKHEIQVLKMLITNMLSNQPVSAGSYLVVNLNNDSIVLEKNLNQSYSIASITKLMNALIVQENIDNNQTIVLTEKMLEPTGQSPCLFLGLKIKAESLLKASLIQSTNDAAESLAYFIGKDKFLLLMNEKAQQIGMKNTVFYDVHGLSPKNSSTAADLAKLVKYVYQNYPEILTITRDNNFWLADSSGVLLKFQNVNNFYYSNQFIGGKTGYLPQSKQTIAAVFQVKQEPIALVLLYSNNRQADAFTILKQLGK